MGWSLVCALGSTISYRLNWAARQNTSAIPMSSRRSWCAGHPYFLLHASAMELQRMVTQPQLTICSAPHFAKPRQHIHGHEYRFVAVKPEQFFGLTEVWVTKQQPIKVSDKGAKHLRRTATARICRRHSRSCQSTLDDEKRNQAELSSRLCPSLRPWGSQAPTRVLRELYKVAPSRQLERLRIEAYFDLRAAGAYSAEVRRFPSAVAPATEYALKLSKQFHHP